MQSEWTFEDECRIELYQVSTGSQSPVDVVARRHAADAHNQATVEANAKMQNDDSETFDDSPTVTLNVQNSPEDPRPMERLRIEYDSTGVTSFGDRYLVTARTRFRGGSLDPDHPPCLIGLRIFRAGE